MAKAVKTQEPTVLELLFRAAGKSLPAVSNEYLPVPAVKEVVEADRSTRGHRKARLLDALQEFDVDTLQAKREELDNFISLITRSLGEDLILNEEYAYTLVEQALAVRNLVDLAQTCQEQIKRVAFEHFTAKLAEEGHPDPANVNATLEVEELGFALRREGAGYGNASIDEELLKEALGSDWHKVVVTEYIPAQEVTMFSEDLLWNLVKDRPELLEKVKASLVPGDSKKARLNLRPI
jgi:hypothetical protein